MIFSNAIQILDENRGDLSILDYFNREKENDPRFFNWLFGYDADNIQDFGIGMTKKQLKEFEIFELSVVSLQEIRDCIL